MNSLVTLYLFQLMFLFIIILITIVVIPITAITITQNPCLSPNISCLIIDISQSQSKQMNLSIMTHYIY